VLSSQYRGLKQMKQLALVYERGSEENTIDVCVDNGLFLGKIFSQGVFGLGFQQATRLNDEDKNEINRVIQTIQAVM
jgi:hypothetical protein